MFFVVQSNSSRMERPAESLLHTGRVDQSVTEAALHDRPPAVRWSSMDICQMSTFTVASHLPIHTHTFVHWGLSCEVLVRPPGETWGSVFRPRTQPHMDQGDRGSTLPISGWLIYLPPEPRPPHMDVSFHRTLLSLTSLIESRVPPRTELDFLMVLSSFSSLSVILCHQSHRKISGVCCI